VVEQIVQLIEQRCGAAALGLSARDFTPRSESDIN
jgi:hypothetical protein